MKHIDICQTALEILDGEDVLKEERADLRRGLSEHAQLEIGAVERAERIMKNVWIRENKALIELINKLKDDEKRHVEALTKLADKTFFRLNPEDFILIFRDTEWAEERYRRSKEFWTKEAQRKTNQQS